MGLSGLATANSARATFAALSNEVTRWLTGLCQPAPTYCPDDPLLEHFAAPREHIKDKGDRYDLRVDLPSLDAKHVSVFSQGQRLLLCGKPRQVQRARPAAMEARAGVCQAAQNCPGCEAGQLLTSFRMPPDADLPRMSAAFTQGSLAVRVPKRGQSNEAQDTRTSPGSPRGKAQA
jgi:HSP20 family molecular chaperone IbpA